VRSSIDVGRVVRECICEDVAGIQVCHEDEWHFLNPVHQDRVIVRLLVCVGRRVRSGGSGKICHIGLLAGLSHAMGVVVIGTTRKPAVELAQGFFVGTRVVGDLVDLHTIVWWVAERLSRRALAALSMLS